VDRVLSCLTARLIKRQLASGGFSFSGLQQASVEATCLSALGLAWAGTANVAMAIRFLLDSQRADGGWPAFTGDPGPSWTTALALSTLTDSRERRFGRSGTSIEVALVGARQGRQLVLALEI
jgi:hypothetical protein